MMHYSLEVGWHPYRLHMYSIETRKCEARHRACHAHVTKRTWQRNAGHRDCDPAYEQHVVYQQPLKIVNARQYERS